MSCLVGLLGLALLGACGAEDPETSIQRDREARGAFEGWGEGEAPEPCTIQIRLTASLGAEEDLTSVISGQGVSVAWVDGLGWIVSDFPADVLIYDPDGRFQGRLGERGQGPGEWSRPARVVVDRTDSIWVSNLQGRAVVFAPDGTPARTLSSPQLLPIDGFLEDGNPYSLAFRPSPEDRTQGMRTQGTLLARAWDRGSGEPAGDLGPGAVDGPGPPALTPMLIGPGTVASGSSLYAAVNPELWLARWTAAGEDTIATGQQVAAGLREVGVDALGDLPQPEGIAAAPDGGFWLLGSLRVLGDEQEQALREEESAARGLTPTALEVARSPNVLNRVHDGLLLHLTQDGQVTSAVRFEEVPFGFVSNASRFFTLAQGDTGLLQARIWGFECR
jgi:hypothetical protein